MLLSAGTNREACFVTRSELNKFEAFSRKMATKVWNKLISRAQSLLSTLFTLWVLKTRELVKLDKPLARFDPTMDPPRLLRKQEKTEIGEDSKLLVAGLRILKLHPLPDTHSQMQSNGILKVHCWPKFNSFLTAHAGPAPWCSWVILGKLLLSGYPFPSSHHLPTTIQRKRESIERQYLESIFSAGVGVFVGLHSKEECIKHEKLNNFPPLKASMLDKLKDVEKRALTERGQALHSLELLLQKRELNISNYENAVTHQSPLECKYNPGVP